MDIKNLYTLLILGIIIFLFGIVFNFAVITGNNCKMPVNMNYFYETNTHISYKNIAENDLKLKYEHFADKYQFNKPFSEYIIYYSIGDVFLFVGGLIFILSHILISSKLYIKRYTLKKNNI